MNRIAPRSQCLVATLIATALALAACGGSDDPPQSAPPPAGVSLSLSGTAATGAAISGGTVSARCDGGSGSATTGADGSYKIDMAEGALPCVLRVSSADGATVLHSLASGRGNSATANITPVSELIVAQLAGSSTADYFGGFDDSRAGSLSADKVQAAAAAVVATLASAGVDLSAVGDVLSAKLVAAHGSTPGNGFDELLDRLAAQLTASGTTLAALTETVARNSPQAPATAVSAVPSLPAELLLRPAAPNCASLRSGTYRLVFFAPGDGGQAFTDTLKVDASSLKTTGSDGEVSELTAAGDCRYTLASGGELVVTAAGVGVLRSAERPGFVAGMAFPEQRHPLSVTAGTWNYTGLGQTNDDNAPVPVQLFSGQMTVDGNGKLTASRFCEAARDCVDEALDAREFFAVDADGSFRYEGSSPAFVYRAGGGEVMIVLIDEDGTFAVLTRKVARTLPAVGDLGRFVNFQITPQYTAPQAAYPTQNTVTALAGDGSSYSRESVTDFMSGVTRPETIVLNSFLDGFLRRVPGTVTNSAGASSNVSEFAALPIRGMGITLVAILATNNLVLSVAEPAQP